MFESILDCPKCQKRFHYEHDAGEYPPFIRCPECGEESHSADFSVLILCHQCHSKLKMPLDILHDTDNVCPKCGAAIVADFIDTLHNGLPTIAGNDFKQQPAKMLQDGEIFDKYKIVKFLGKGGMAEVYLAEHLLLKQSCALKLMQNKLDNDGASVFVKRFVREAKLTHSLNHPNIVRVLDAGCDLKKGNLFLSMEYIEGKTLNEIIREKEFSEEELLELLSVMANALKALEEAKIVHRDIKPSNIMYSTDGVYKLMDLGIARIESDHQAGDMTLTMEQASIGTPGYASPEQCRSAHLTDIRSDIFSLGATIYHAATKNLPFTGNTPVDIILKVMECTPEPINQLRSDLSNGFVQLVRKMMSKNPSDRFQNVDELQEAIAGLRNGKTLPGKIRDALCQQKGKGKGSILKAAAGIVLLGVIGSIVFLSLQKNSSVSLKKSQSSAVVIPQAPQTPAKSASPVPSAQSAPVKRGSTAAAAPLAPEKKQVPVQPERPAAVTQKQSETKTSADRDIKFEKQGGAIVPTLAVNNDDLKKDARLTLSLEEQLAQIRKNYLLFERRCRLMRDEKLPEGVPGEILKARQEIISKANEMLPLWKKRIEYLEQRNKKIIEAKKKSYPATRKFQNILAAFTQDSSKRNNQDQKLKISNELIDLLKTSEVDPNAKVLCLDLGKKDSLCEAILFEAVRRTSPLENKAGFIRELCALYADPSFLNRAIGYNFHDCETLVVEYGLASHALEASITYFLLESYGLQQQEKEKVLMLFFFDGVLRLPRLLSLAVQSRVPEYLLIMLAMGIDPNIQNNDLETALFATYRINGGEKFRTLLLAAGADPSIRNRKNERAEDMKPDNQLIEAWERQNIPLIKKYLGNEKVSGKLLPNGNTFLVDACLKRNVELVKLLLSLNADPNQLNGKKNIGTRYPILAATQLLQSGKGSKTERRKEMEILKLLLDHGAQWTISPEEEIAFSKKNIFSLLIKNAPERNELLPLFIPHLKFSNESGWYLVDRILKDEQGKLSKKNQLLLLHSFPGDFMIKRIFSWLYYIQVDKYVINKVLQAGLSPRAKGWTNNAPLIYWAVLGKQPREVIETLLKAGADPYATNDKGQSAFDKTKDRKVLDLLKKYGKRNSKRR